MTPLSFAIDALFPEHGAARTAARFASDALCHAGYGALGYLALTALTPVREAGPAALTLGVALWWGVCYVACRRLLAALTRRLASRSAGAA